MSQVAASSLGDSGGGLPALDRLAERLLTTATRSIRVEPATSVLELAAVLRLRYDQEVADGRAEAGRLPDGVERDEHDGRSVHVAAWDGDALVGTVRLVLPSAIRRLPVEEAFDIDVEPRGQVVEIGRLVIAQDRRGDPADLTWGAMFARAWMEVRARGFSVMAGAASEDMVARYRSLGLPFEILGPARPCWGRRRHPVRLDPAAAEDPGWY